MLAKRHKRIPKSDADLDITSFMNLMIVLVPVLLMMMVFSRITVVELSLPGLASLSDEQSIEQQVLEVKVTPSGLEIYFPQAYLVTQVPMLEAQADMPAQHDFIALQTALKQVKQTLLAEGIDKKDITLLMQQDTDYQTIISLIDATRSYKDVVAASVVDAELFPDVSLADAPSQVSIVTPSNTGGGQ